MADGKPMLNARGESTTPLLEATRQLAAVIVAYETAQTTRRQTSTLPSLAQLANGVLVACDARRAVLQRELASLEQLTGAVQGVKNHLHELMMASQ